VKIAVIYSYPTQPRPWIQAGNARRSEFIRFEGFCQPKFCVSNSITAVQRLSRQWLKMGLETRDSPC